MSPPASGAAPAGEKRPLPNRSRMLRWAGDGRVHPEERRMNRTDREHLMRCYPVLEELPRDLLRKVEESARLVQAPAGRRLFGEESPCTHYPLLVEGVIRASKCGPDGHEILLYRLNPGESCVITGVALLGETPYPAIGAAETKLALFGGSTQAERAPAETSPKKNAPVVSALRPRVDNRLS